MGSTAQTQEHSVWAASAIHCDVFKVLLYLMQCGGSVVSSVVSQREGDSLSALVVF